MAESSVSSLLLTMGKLVSQEASLFEAVEGQVRHLFAELEWIQVLLECAEAEGGRDKSFNLWVNQVRAAAFDAEDVINEFISKVERKRHQRFNNLKFLNFLPACLNLVDKLLLAHELSGRITDINATLEKILVNKKRYIIEYPRASEASSSSKPWSYSDQMVDRIWRPTVEETIVGREYDVKAVKGKLLEGAMERVVVAILGMGGLGKTTLAKKVSNDTDVHLDFSCRAWVNVSQECNIRELLLGIANCVTTLTDKQKSKNEKELGDEVYNCLQGKRYLIVIDDMWNTDVWQSLSQYLPEELNKSRVLITTRNEVIALYAHSDCYMLRLLGEKESWELFLNKVRRAECPGLEEFKKEIVAKCRGLPLTIVVLGGLLSLRYLTRDSWRKVLESVDLHLSQGPDSCLGILALSYNDLPSYLKRCFLYCGVFPEDSEIKASKLIRLWVAEGFVQKRGEERLEDIAEDYLYELIQRSMIQVADARVNGRVKSCRIHDLLRDLAISEAKDDTFFEVDQRIGVDVLLSRVRRLIGNINQTIPPHLQNSKLRSLILNRYPIDEVDGVFLRKCPKLLRVLHVNLVQDRGISIKLSGKIGELVHLKYLCLSGIRDIRLPSSIGGLVNLQILDLGYNKTRMPHTIWKLQQLRHLNCWRGRISSRQSMREWWVEGHLGVHQMTNLQTLYLQGGDWLKDNNLGKLAHHLKQLKLDLTSCRELKEGSFRSIAQLTGLQKLKLEVESTTILFPGLESFSHHKRLYKLHLVGPIPKLPVETTFYPPNLMQLKLFDTKMEEDPMPILGRLPNLRILILLQDSYMGMEMNCPDGGFHQLKFLQMQWLQRLEDLSVEEGAMPDLKTLKIEYCDKMRKFPHGLLQLKKLQRLNLYGLSQELMSGVLETQGEDWNITSQVPPRIRI